MESFNLLLKSVDPKAPLSVEALLRELFIGIPIPIIKLAAGIMGAELTEDSIRRLIVREGKSSSIRRKITLKHPTVNLSNLLSSSDAVLLIIYLTRMYLLFVLLCIYQGTQLTLNTCLVILLV